MTGDQAAIAVPLLNSYAHQYLGLGLGDVRIAGGNGPDGWILIVAKLTDTTPAKDFDAAKAMIDGLAAARGKRG